VSNISKIKPHSQTLLSLVLFLAVLVILQMRQT